MKFLIPVLTFSILLIGCATQPPADILSLSPNQFASEYYIVKPKDSIYSIARDQNINYQVLARINNIVPPYIIYRGQRLLLREKTNNNLPASHNVAMTNPQFASTGRANAQPKLQIHRQTTNFPKSKNALVAKETTIKVSTKNVQQAQNNVVIPAQPPQQHANAPEEVVKAAPATEIENARKRINWIWPVRGPILTRFAKGVVQKNGINIGGREGTAVKAVAPGKVVYSGSGLRGYGHLIIVKHANNFLSAYAHNRKNLVQEGATVKIGQQIAEMGQTGSNKVMLHFEVRHNGIPVDPEKILPRK